MDALSAHRENTDLAYFCFDSLCGYYAVGWTCICNSKETPKGLHNEC